MEELKCPNCGTVFEVDESDYARIVSQIRDKEFDIELKRREQTLEEKNKNNIEIALMKQEKEQKEALDKKNAEIISKQNEIAELKSKLASFGDEKKIAVMEAVSAKEKELQEKSTKITDLQSQLKIKKRKKK